MASEGAGLYPLTSLVDADRISVDRSNSAVGNYVTAATLASYVLAETAVLPYLSHTGAIPATANTTGTLVSPITTSSYCCILNVVGNATVTGISLLTGTTSSGSLKAYLATTAGAMLASTASTAFGASSSYQRVAFTSPYTTSGPGTYVVIVQVSSTVERFRAHTFGDFPAWSTSGTTFNTFPTAGVAVVSTFTAGVGPIMSLY